MAPCELWSFELNREDVAPSLVGTAPDLSAGLQEFWLRTLHFSVQDNGAPTTTRFRLEIPGQAPLSLPLSLSHDGMAVLRGRRFEPSLFVQLASLHAQRLAVPFSLAGFLEVPVTLPEPVQRAVDVLRAALSLKDPLRPERVDWCCGPRESVHLLVTAAGDLVHASRWTVRALAAEEGPIDVSVFFEHLGSAGWSSRLEGGHETLLAVLTAAGLGGWLAPSPRQPRSFRPHSSPGGGWRR